MYILKSGNRETPSAAAFRAMLNDQKRHGYNLDLPGVSFRCIKSTRTLYLQKTKRTNGTRFSAQRDFFRSNPSPAISDLPDKQWIKLGVGWRLGLAKLFLPIKPEPPHCPTLPPRQQFGQPIEPKPRPSKSGAQNRRCQSNPAIRRWPRGRGAARIASENQTNQPDQFVVKAVSTVQTQGSDP